MDYIAQNPYRVLGVFVNDPLKSRTANAARIRAFNKVGKPCSFDSDFEEIFGNIDRSEKELLRAERLLSSAKDSEFYGLLWLHRTEHLPLTPSAAADIVSASITHNSFGDVVNSIICLLYVGNYDKAAELIVELFNKKDNTSDNNKHRFLKYVIDTFNELTFSNWWNTFKKAFIKDNQHSDTSILLSDFFNIESCSRLKRITDFGSINKDTVEWKNIFGVRILANSIIEVLKESCDIESKQANAESQIVLSGYAQAMLKACKRYYDSTRFWEAKPVLDILVVLREVYKISYSSKIIDECTEFGKKLKSESNYLAPTTVRKQAVDIRKQIEEFCQKPNETKWANTLLINCVQPLNEIRKELGPNNLYYKRVSSQIANNALYACEDEIEHIDEQADDSVNLIIQKMDIIKLAVQFCANIRVLEVDDTFNTYGFNKIVKALDLLCEEYNEKTINDVEPSFSFHSQDDFIHLNQDYNSLVQYVKIHTLK